MIDSHCHLYTEEFAEDIHLVIERAEAAGVEKFYLPAIDSSTHKLMIDLAQKFPGKCFPMIGLHPCSVKDDYEEELAIIENLLERHTFAAIGETGLDFHWDTTFEKEQYKALHRQIDLALKHNLPLVLHTRKAMQQTIDVVKQYKGATLRGIFHCFGGSVQEAEQIIACNFLLGIGGVITYKNAGLQQILPHIDLKYLVLETDAPYLAPVPYRGKRNESSYLTEVVAKIAEIKCVSIADVAEVTTANAENLFRVAKGGLK